MLEHFKSKVSLQEKSLETMYVECETIKEKTEYQKFKKTNLLGFNKGRNVQDYIDFVIDVVL